MKKYISIFILSFLAVGLSSCLKDENILDPSGSKNVVEFYNVTSPVSATSAPYVAYVPATLEVVPEAEFTIMLSYSGAEKSAPQDIVIELAPAPDALETYNIAQGTDLNQLPASLYELPTSVTIKKGEKRVSIPVKIKPADFDQSISNALALTIKSASHGEISGNFGTAIFSLPIKSIWEGTYDYYVNNNYGSLDGNVGEYSTSGVKLSTVGPNRLRVSAVAQTYGGWSEYQFNADNTSIIETAAFSGSLLPSSIQEVVLVDPENLIFELRWTWLGRGVVERYTRTGD